MSKIAGRELSALRGLADMTEDYMDKERRLRIRVHALEIVLADRERELLEIKGPCSNGKCRLHYAHSGPCDMRPPMINDDLRCPASGSESTTTGPGPAVDLIEHAAGIIVAKMEEPHTAPYHWAGALWEAGMLVAPGAAPDVGSTR
jgi:hypothetical protein